MKIIKLAGVDGVAINISYIVSFWYDSDYECVIIKTADGDEYRTYEDVDSFENRLRSLL